MDWDGGCGHFTETVRTRAGRKYCHSVRDLLLLRDVLTQTVLLLIFGSLGLSLRLRWSLKRLGGIADITATTYLVAAIHKLGVCRCKHQLCKSRMAANRQPLVKPSS